MKSLLFHLYTWYHKIRKKQTFCSKNTEKELTNICSRDKIQGRTDVRKHKFGLAGYKGGSCMKKYLIALVMIVMIMSCFFSKDSGYGE